MFRKIGNIRNEVKFLIALLCCVIVVVYILGSGFIHHSPSDIEKVYTAMFGIGAFLWARIEHTNMIKPDLEDILERTDALRYQHHRLLYAIERAGLKLEEDDNGAACLKDKYGNIASEITLENLYESERR
mgnify:CR=1 FL=1